MRRARETRGLSVENLATEMNIPISRDIEIENGHADVSMYELYCFMLYVTPNAVSDIWRK